MIGRKQKSIEQGNNVSVDKIGRQGNAPGSETNSQGWMHASIRASVVVRGRTGRKSGHMQARLHTRVLHATRSDFP